MKFLLKTVSLTLTISVTALFFSSYKKVEAAGVGAAVALDAGLYIIAAIATGIASCLTVEVIKELNEFVESNYFADSFTKDEEGLFSYHPLSDNQQMDAVVEAAVAQYNNKVKNNEISSGDTSSSLSSESYSDCVSSGLKDVLGSGAASGITSGISVINGKPQKVTTIQSESIVEVFDYIGFEYATFNSFNEFKCDFTEGGQYFKPFFITTDNILYWSTYDVYSSSGRYNSFSINYRSTCQAQGTTYGTFDDKYASMRFYEKNGIFCAALYSSVVEGGKLYRSQVIVSKPKYEAYPVLFSDNLSYTSIATTNYQNSENSIQFRGVSGTSPLNDSEILSKDILTVGYIVGQVSDTNLDTAAKMLAGTENAVQSGITNTTYSDLSDIEKAIYALAKQQGITYDEMLEKCNLVVENGQIYLEGLDGVTHSIDSLLAEFEKLLEQGDITNENIAASTEQLKAILDYLKGLNIEGLGEYIQQLETTLDGLKQGDEDREAILGDISGQLTDLKDYLDSLGLAGIGADIKNISQILSDSAALELDVTEIESIDADWYIEKFPFCLPFDFYRILTLFVRDPVPPVFTIPIEADFTSFGLNQSVDEEIVLDLTIFKVNGVDIVQVVLNFVCILGFVLMLIHTTTKFFV